MSVEEATKTFGNIKTDLKLDQIIDAITEGARELDPVMNIALFKDGEKGLEKTSTEFERIRHCVNKQEEQHGLKRGTIKVKMIIEATLLSPSEITMASILCKKFGFTVKTSTGFVDKQVGSQPQFVERIKEALKMGPRSQKAYGKVGIKAAGGVTKETAPVLIGLGVTRLGVGYKSIPDILGV